MVQVSSYRNRYDPNKDDISELSKRLRDTTLDTGLANARNDERSTAFLGRPEDGEELGDPMPWSESFFDHIDCRSPPC